MVAVILEEPASSIFYTENEGSRCFIITLLLGWGEIESFGTAAVNEPAVSAPDDK